MVIYKVKINIEIDDGQKKYASRGNITAIHTPFIRINNYRVSSRLRFFHISTKNNARLIRGFVDSLGFENASTNTNKKNTFGATATANIKNYESPRE